VPAASSAWWDGESGHPGAGQGRAGQGRAGRAVAAGPRGAGALLTRAALGVTAWERD